jgi:hypothetical protein
MNLLTYLHSIFHHEESLRWEEEVEATELEEEVEAMRLEEEEDLDEDRTLRRRTRRRRRGRSGMRTVWGCMMRGWGDGSTSGPASSRRVRTSHLVRPPVAPHEENMVVIVPSGDG